MSMHTETSNTFLSRRQRAVRAFAVVAALCLCACSTDDQPSVIDSYTPDETRPLTLGASIGAEKAAERTTRSILNDLNANYLGTLAGNFNGGEFVAVGLRNVPDGSYMTPRRYVAATDGSLTHAGDPVANPADTKSWAWPKTTDAIGLRGWHCADLYRTTVQGASFSVPAEQRRWAQLQAHDFLFAPEVTLEDSATEATLELWHQLSLVRIYISTETPVVNDTASVRLFGPEWIQSANYTMPGDDAVTHGAWGPYGGTWGTPATAFTDSVRPLRIAHTSNGKQILVGALAVPQQTAGRHLVGLDFCGRHYSYTLPADAEKSPQYLPGMIYTYFLELKDSVLVATHPWEEDPLPGSLFDVKINAWDIIKMTEGNPYEDATIVDPDEWPVGQGTTTIVDPEDWPMGQGNTTIVDPEDWNVGKGSTNIVDPRPWNPDSLYTRVKVLPNPWEPEQSADHMTIDPTPWDPDGDVDSLNVWIIDWQREDPVTGILSGLYVFDEMGRPVYTMTAGAISYQSPRTEGYTTFYALNQEVFRDSIPDKNTSSLMPYSFSNTENGYMTSSSNTQVNVLRFKAASTGDLTIRLFKKSSGSGVTDTSTPIATATAKASRVGEEVMAPLDHTITLYTNEYLVFDADASTFYCNENAGAGFFSKAFQANFQPGGKYLGIDVGYYNPEPLTDGEGTWYITSYTDNVNDLTILPYKHELVKVLDPQMDDVYHTQPFWYEARGFYNDWAYPSHMQVKLRGHQFNALRFKPGTFAGDIYLYKHSANATGTNANRIGHVHIDASDIGRDYVVKHIIDESGNNVTATLGEDEYLVIHLGEQTSNGGLLYTALNSEAPNTSITSSFSSTSKLKFYYGYGDEGCFTNANQSRDKWKWAVSTRIYDTTLDNYKGEKGVDVYDTGGYPAGAIGIDVGMAN